MNIVNLTRNKVLGRNAKYVKSFKDRLFGLLLKSNQKGALIFKTRFGIHTLFLKNPIYVLVLDKNLKVVLIKRKLKPFTVFFWDPRYPWVIEFPENFLSTVKLGDEIVTQVFLKKSKKIGKINHKRL